jgi:hypothetical protein
LGIEVVAVAALTALGSKPPFAAPSRGWAGWEEWLRTAPPADVLVAALRWVALLGAWWLLASTLLYVGASMTRVPGAVRVVRWTALPPVRRAVDTAFAVSVVAGSVLAPTAAHAASSAPTATTVRDGHAGGLASLPAATTAPTTPSTTSPARPSTPPPAAPSSPAPVVAPTAAPAASVVVQPGDNLWELSASHVAAATGRARADVADAELAPYWIAVCEQNRDSLLSRDPNLIQPGEVVTFPTVR